MWWLHAVHIGTADAKPEPRGSDPWVGGELFSFYHEVESSLKISTSA